jgi:hypothetical protein
MAQQYRHFKGNLYTLLDVGYCLDDNKFYAIYRRTDHPSNNWSYARHSETEEIYGLEPDGSILKNGLFEGNKTHHEAIIEDAIESGLWIRPLEMFFGYKEVDGKQVRRFERVD